MIKCNVCGSDTYKIKFLNLKSISHTNFKSIDLPLNLKCQKCNLIENNNVKNIFKTKEYFNINQTDLFVYKKNLKIKKSDYQSNYITKILNIKNKDFILDFGCNKADLLKSLLINNKNQNIFGFEINQGFVKNLKKNKINFDNFYRSKQKFDIIIFSHSLFYVKNLKKLFFCLKKKLKKNSRIYVESPDISQNPIYSIMGDQNYIFTKNNLKNIFNYFGFSVSLSNIPFTENFCLVAKISNRKKISFLNDKSFENSLAELNKKIDILNKIRKKCYIFGTTSKAAFIDSILKNKVICFVDENTSNKIKFRSKKIIHPKNLSNQNLIIVPTAKKSLIMKLKKNYKGKFVNV